MTANIITIGDEILIGQVVNTNSAWIAGKLNEAGITVSWQVSIGDKRESIWGAINESIALNNIVIITGGLGPTKDDITKTTLAEYFDCGMVRDEQTYEANRKRLKEMGIEYNHLNQAQSMVPACCRVLPNANGTAPGMWFDRNGKVLVALPGVPSEMEAIMTDYVIPMLKSHFTLRHTVHRTAVTFGLAESMLAARIADWENSLPDHMHLAYLPNLSQIRLRLSAYEIDNETDVEAEVSRKFAELEQIIPDYLIGYGKDTVASVTAAMLTEHGATLSVAESCTGGALAAMLTAISGASKYFAGGVIAYSNDVKTGLLGVNEKTLAKHGAVSREVAEEMAQGVRNATGTTYSIAATGISGPDGGSEDKPVGTVWIAVATPDHVFSRRFMFGGKRYHNIERGAVSAINFLRLVLLEKPDVETVNGIL